MTIVTRDVLERFTPRLSTLVKLENLHVESDTLGGTHPIIVRDVCKGFFSVRGSSSEGRGARTVVGVARRDRAIPENFQIASVDEREALR